MSKRTIISGIVLAGLFLLSLWVFFSSSPSEVQTGEENNNKNQQLQIEDFAITETKEGKKFWEVYATQGVYNETIAKILLINIKGNFYKDEKVVLSIEAPNAIYDSAKRQFILQNGARAANDKDVYITAKEICWAGTEDKITATGNVKIIKNNELVTTSDKSIFNTDFTNLKLIGKSNSYIYRK